MGRMKRLGKIGIIVIAIPVFLAFLGLLAPLLYLGTEGGKERLRGIVEARLDERARGRAEIGWLETDLLRGVRLGDVSIVDEAGRPFLEAEEIGIGFNLWPLLSQQLVLRNLELTRAHLILDRPPGEEWNFLRIFEPDADADPDPGSGWGDHVEILDIDLIESHVTVQMAWEPNPELGAEARQERIRAALAGEVRERIEEVPGGYQQVMTFRDVDAKLPRVLVASADTDAVLVEIAELRMLAEPFRPPGALIQQLEGDFTVGGDFLTFDATEVVLPGSELRGNGTFAFGAGRATLLVEAEPIDFEDLRFLHLPLPEGGGDLITVVEMDGPTTRILAEGVDLRVGEGGVEGRADLTVGEPFRIGESELRFTAIATELIEGIVPDLELPRPGSFSGHIAASPTSDPNGAEHALEVDAELRFEDSGVARTSALSARGIAAVDPQGVHAETLRVQLDSLHLDMFRAQLPDLPTGSVLSGPIHLAGSTAEVVYLDADLALSAPTLPLSRIGVEGGVDLEGPIAFEALQVVLDPLEARWVAAVANAPLDGAFHGSARLDGAPGSGLLFQTSLEHRPRDQTPDAAPPSRIEARGELLTSGEGWISAELLLHSVSLATAGRLLPEAALRGEVSGGVIAEGSFDAIRFDADLGLPEDGALAAEGSVDLTGPEPGYRLALFLEQVDLSAVSERIPVTTAIGGSARVEGRGLDPATLEAVASLELTDADASEVRALAAGLEVDGAGLLLVDSLALEAGTEASPGQLRALLRGSVGLVAERSGSLAYRLEIDSLGLLAPFVPEATEPTEPRPGARAALGDALPALGVPRDALHGSLQAEGVVQGSLARFGVDGELSFREVRALGISAEDGEAVYQIEGVGGSGTSGSLEARIRSVLAAGLGYQEVDLHLAFQDGDTMEGLLALDVRQTEEVELVAQVGFQRSPAEVIVRIEGLALTLPDAGYRASGPATIRWSEDELEVHGLRLEGAPALPGAAAAPAALLRVDGRLPREGVGSLEVQLRAVPIEHLLTLAQESRTATGEIHVDLEATGTLALPEVRGEVALTSLVLEGEPVPDVETTLAYVDRELLVDLLARDERGVHLTAQARLPVDLGLTDVEGDRLLDGPIQADIVLVALPIEALPALVDQVEAVEGRIAGRVTIAGTFDAPEVGGDLDLEIPDLTIVPIGIRITDLSGRLQLQDRRLTIDSLVAYSGGPIRFTGALDLIEGREPRLDVAVEVRNAWVIDTEDARLRVDADLTLQGPFDELVLEGEVRTRSGVVYIPETDELAAAGPLDLEDPATFARVDQRLVEARDRLIPPSPLTQNLTAEISLLVDRDVWLRSTEANVELHTLPEVGPLTIRLNGVRPANLTVEGTIAMDRGEYSVMGRRFDLSHGSVIFLGGRELDPLVRLTAEHEVNLPGREIFDIRVALDGPVSDLETELGSTAQPPLSQTDLLSFLVFGREAGSLLQHSGSTLSGQGSSGGPLVGQVAMRATQQLATVAMEAMVADLELELARSAGLDVLNIQPAELPAEVFTGGYLDVLRGTEVRAGAYVTPRLFISGHARPTFVHPGVVVEYETPNGYLWRTSWRPRFLPAPPTLSEEAPDRASVFGSFLFREWRF